MPSTILNISMEQNSVSLVSELCDDGDTSVSDVTTSSAVGSSFDGRFSPIPSDQRSIYSYTSSVNRESILKDVHGRVVNSTNQVNWSI